MPEKKSVEAVLLDMDGTLLDSIPMHAESWQRAFEKFGIEVEYETARQQIGKGGDQLLPVFVPKEKLDTLGKEIEKYRKDLFEREYKDKLKALPQARQLVQRMKDEGLTIALASSGSKEELQHYKKVAGVDDLIEEETSSDDAEKSKPHPDIFAAALERVGVEASKAIALGDTPWDAQAAGKAGVRTIGVMSGGWSKADLEEAGCLEVYEDVAELLAKYDRSVLSGR